MEKHKRALIILIDQDGPLANFEGGFLIQWRKNFPQAPHIPLRLRKSPKIYDDSSERFLHQPNQVVPFDTQAQSW